MRRASSRSRLLTAGLCALAAAFPAYYLVAAPSEPKPAPQEQPPAAAAATAAAEPQDKQEQTDVPVRAVVLFSSGVGYFEHFGTVQGNGSTELRFKTEQINDILKSLMLQDLDGGRAGTVSYPSQEPVARTLKSFQVDITANPSLPELLNQLRGARLTVSIPDQQPLTGVILGVEKKHRVVGDKDKGQTEEQSILTLKIGRRVRTVPLDDVQELAFEDAELDAELDKALSALAEARDQDKKPVTIEFRGDGERQVRIGYVVETPIWKTSYRLIVTDEPDKGEKNPDAPDAPGAPGTPNAPDAQGKEPGRAAPKPGQGKQANGAPAGADTGGKLQGWAIVENQTDNDWNNVQLSLVSGRPISFIQDLYHPLYLPRPVVHPELYASLRPQTYEGGMTPEQMEQMQEARANAPDFNLQGGDEVWRDNGGGGGGAGLFGGGGQGEEGEEDTPSREEPMDPTASVRSVASAGRIGELFQYTVGNVSIRRQRSAMIPIVTEAVEVEKLSIYNESVLTDHPLNGARVKNTTKSHLLQGPVTVIEAGSYAGDARIDNLPPGEERLLSYGVDLQTLVIPENLPEDVARGGVLTGRIAKGVMELQVKRVDGRRYVIQNKGDVARTVVVEYPKSDWKLVDPAKADEITDAVYRFHRRTEPGATAALNVRTEHVETQSVALLTTDVPALVVYVKEGSIPKPVRDALAKAAELKTAMAGLQRQLEERKQRLGEVTTGQARIRENMKSISPDTEYYKRLATKLNEQETQIETMEAEIATLVEEHDKARDELETYLGKLSIG